MCVYAGYPSKCRVCIGNCLGRFMPMYSVWCRPCVHWWSIHMASPVVWIRQLSGASLDLSHSDLVRYRCYKRKPVGAHPVHLQICVLLLRRAYTWRIYGVCVWGGGGGGVVDVCVDVCVCVCLCLCVFSIVVIGGRGHDGVCTMSVHDCTTCSLSAEIHEWEWEYKYSVAQ